VSAQVAQCRILIYTVNSEEKKVKKISGMITSLNVCF